MPERSPAVREHPPNIVGGMGGSSTARSTEAPKEPKEMGMTKAKRKRGYPKRTWRQREEARWAAKSGPVTIIRPANNAKDVPPGWKLDGLDLARAQYHRYKVRKNFKIIPTDHPEHTPPPPDPDPGAASGGESRSGT